MFFFAKNLRQNRIDLRQVETKMIAGPFYT